MKTIILSIFLLAGFTSNAQTTDENGRVKGSSANFASVKAEVNPLMKSEISSNSNARLVYNMPDGETAGKIVLFHPRKDLELKTINISSASGSVDIDLAPLGHKAFSAGLYDSKGKFIKSINVN